MATKGMFLLLMAVLELIVLADADLNVKLAADILAIAIILDYLLVAFAKGISAALGMYLRVCFEEKHSDRFVPVHTFGVKWQNIMMAEMFVIGVYVLPWVFKMCVQPEMEIISRISTTLMLGVHHIVMIGGGAG